MLLIEGAKIKQLPQQRPRKGQIGNQDGGAGFAGIPVYPRGFVRRGEAVVFIEDRGNDSENTQTEDAAQDELAFQR